MRRGPPIPHPPVPSPQKYQNRRTDYIAAFLGGKVINWKGVSALYAKAVAGKYPSLNVLDLQQSPWPISP